MTTFKSKLLLFLTLLIIMNFATAQVCDEDQQGPCGETINSIGHGAVELCSKCFVCGLSDGVCPAFYSTGEISQENFYVQLRQGIQDSIRPLQDDDYTIAYNTGKTACEYFGGVFEEARTRSLLTQDWVADPSITENDEMSERNDYVKAICSETSKRPSCDVCVDPDCIAVVKGLAYVPASGAIQSTPIPNAIIEIYPQVDETDTTMRRSATSDDQGRFVVDDAYFGNVVVSCAAYGYDSFRKEITLKPGINIIDCRMGHGSCDADCTIPSAQYGERVCTSACQGLEGCEFQDITINDKEYTASQVMSLCEDLPKNFFRELETEVNEEEGKIIVHGINCCKTSATMTYFLFDLSQTQGISTLITRRFNRLMDGKPVFLNIISYKR